MRREKEKLVDAMLTYLLKSALLLTFLYGSFALLLSRETFHRFNRLALLSVLVASLVLPAVQLTVKMPSILQSVEVPVPKISGMALPTEDVEQENATPQSALSEVAEPIQAPAFHISAKQILLTLYFIGLLASLAFFFLQIFHFLQEKRGGVRTRDEFGNRIVIHGGDFAPYSFLHYIIISVSDYEHLRRPILAHEQAHIRLGHTYDLLLLEVVKALQWFNPFVYLLGRDLKAVHEYEADNAVLNFGIDAKTYQLLLVTKAVGSRLQTVCNNLSHHSLKKRIKMMHKKNSNRWLMSKGLVLPALMAFALVAWAKPKVEEIIPSNETVSSVVEDNDQVQDNKPVTVAVPGMGLVMTDEVKGFSEKKMLNAFVPKDDAKDFIKKHGPAITVFWLKGTWVVRDEGSYIEEHPDCRYPWAFHTKYYNVMLDGKQLDVNNLPDLPASALKK
ncbi:MAG: M56 family metallopeptidase, partial [Bacteroidaceae bacterium]|nr:M56 family metallopeptidase [Bacteroidaceae bacterium]